MAKQVDQANSRSPMRATKIQGACFGSKRSPVRVWAPRPAGQLTVSFEFAGCTCFGSGWARTETRSAEASAAPGHDQRSKCSVKTRWHARGVLSAPWTSPQARGSDQRRSTGPSLVRRPLGAAASVRRAHLPDPGLRTSLDGIPVAAERRGIGEIEVTHGIDRHTVEDRRRGDVDALGDLAVAVAEELHPE